MHGLCRFPGMGPWPRSCVFLNLELFNWISASNCSEDKRQENEEYPTPTTTHTPVSCMIAPGLSHENRKKNVAFDTDASMSLPRSGTCEDQSK